MSVVIGIDPHKGSNAAAAVDGEVAVAEFQVKASKRQPRELLVLDLAFHPCPLKLLITVDTRHHATERSAAQAKVILERLGCAAVVFRVKAGRDREEMARELVESVDG